MQWVLDLFDKYKVSTRDVTDRYKAFGTGQGGDLLDRPVDAQRLIGQKLNFGAALFPKIGDTRLTYIESGGLELYMQKDKGRYERPCRR